MPSKSATILALSGIAFIILEQARAGKFVFSSSKLFWVSTFTMSLLLRQLFAGTNPKYITNHKQVAQEEEEYDFVIVGGGILLSLNKQFSSSNAWSSNRYCWLCSR